MNERKDNLISLLAAGLLLAAAVAAVLIPWHLARLIDVGVRCGGVEYATPLRIRTSTMDDLMLFLPEDTGAEAKRAYDLVGGVYILHGGGDAKRLSEDFALPVLQYKRLSEQGVNTFPAIHAALRAGAMTHEDVIARANEAVSAMGPLTPRAQTEAAASFVRTEYAVAGGNADALRSDLITAELWHMALLAAAALLAAGIGCALMDRSGNTLPRPLFPAALALGAAVCAFRCGSIPGLILTAEAAVLVLALWRFSPRTRRSVSLAACAVAAAALPSVCAKPLLDLTLAPGQLIALLVWALLAAAPGLVARIGREAQS